jgi:hypothetical protein
MPTSPRPAPLWAIVATLRCMLTNGLLLPGRGSYTLLCNTLSPLAVSPALYRTGVYRLWVEPPSLRSPGVSVMDTRKRRPHPHARPTRS